MNNEWPTFIMVGMQDAFSPVQMSIPGILILLLLLFSATEKHVLVLFSGYFFVFLVLWGIVCDLGGLFTIVSSDSFLRIAAFFYVGIGILFLGFAFVLARQWLMLRSQRGDLQKLLTWGVRLPIYVVGILAGLLAFVLAFSATVWPLTIQVFLQSVFTFTPGRLLDSLALLLIYELMRNIGVVLVVLAVIGHWRGMLHRFKEQKSLVIAFLTAYYLAVGGALIFIMFNKG